MNTVQSPTTPIRELKNYLADFAARCRQMRWFRALFHVGVVGDIVADEVKVHEQIIAEAHGAEITDLEAAKLLEEIVNHKGFRKDLPVLKKALRLIRNGANKSHNVTEIAAI